MTTYGRPTASAGWYDDPAQPFLVRYFDGTTWTAHTAPRPTAPAAPYELAPGAQYTLAPGAQYTLAPAAQVAWTPGYATPAAPASDDLRWVLPVGRSWQAIAAGYVALFALVAWFLGPVALGLGVWGLRAAREGRGVGRGRCWFGIVVGVLASIAFVAMIVS